MEDKNSLNLVVLQFQRDIRSEGDVWSKVKGLEEVDRDREATVMLIELYKKYQNQLSVKGARKKCIWETIAFELTNGGFPVDAEKCHQKWRNLEKIFRKHMHYLKSSRASDPKRVRQPPEYFDQLRPILSNSKASSLHDDLRRSGSSDGKYILLPSGEVVADEEGVLTEDDSGCLLATADVVQIDDGQPSAKRLHLSRAGEGDGASAYAAGDGGESDADAVASILQMGQQLLQQQEQGFRQMREQLDQHHQQSHHFFNSLLGLLQ